MLLAVIIAKLSTFLPETLASYFVGKGMDKLLASDMFLKDELQDVIQETIVEFSDNDTRNYGNKLPFYHSISILEGLLKFRVMAPEDYDPNVLLTAIESEVGIASLPENIIKNHATLPIRLSLKEKLSHRE